jgi:hypothetical protein
VLIFRKPPRSFVLFLLAMIGIGAAVGHLVNAAGLAAFCFFVASIDPKPSWNFWFGKPGNQYDGKGWRFTTGQRAGMTSPKEMRQAPDLKN